MSYYVITSFALGDTQGVVADISGAQSSAEFVGTSSSGNAASMSGNSNSEFIGSTLAFESAFAFSGSSGLTCVGTDGIDVLSLINFNETPGTQDFIDEIPTMSWSIGGTAATGEISVGSKFGSGALVLYGSGGNSYVQGASFSSPHLVSYTLEGWVKYDSSVAGTCLFSPKFGGVGSAGYANLQTDGNWQFFFGTGPTGTFTFTSDVYQHWAMVRDNAAGTFSLYFNGSRLSEVSAGNDNLFTNITLYASGAKDFYCDSTRLSLGVRYSGSTYTVPTAEFSL